MTLNDDDPLAVAQGAHPSHEQNVGPDPPSVGMDTTDVDILFAGIAVADFEGAVAWYARLFGRPADVIVNDGEVMWRFADAAWLYVVRDEKRAGHALVTLSVADLDKTVADIGGRGITEGRIELVGDAGRKASYTDADGNTLSFIEVTTSAR